jgi:crossover junction endodeoxyribonuclease RuvC
MTSVNGATPTGQRVMGVDPGSRITGFGIIDFDGRHSHYVTSGVIRMEEQTFPERLRAIFDRLGEVIVAHRPGVAAVEQVFVRRNPDSALKLGQARGAAICACLSRDIELSEYTASAIKQALTGTGGAGKDQVQYMVRMLLTLSGTLREDASDALAVALCHINRHHMDRALARQGGGA